MIDRDPTKKELAEARQIAKEATGRILPDDNDVVRAALWAVMSSNELASKALQPLKPASDFK